MGNFLEKNSGNNMERTSSQIATGGAIQLESKKADSDQKDVDGKEDGKSEDGDNKEEPELSPEAELRYYASQNNVEKVKELINRVPPVNVNAQDEGPTLTESDLKRYAIYTQKVFHRKTGDSALHIAAENNHVDMINFLFYNQASMELKNRLGSTPLHRAVSCGKPEAVLELLKFKANVHAKNTLGMTPLHIAVASSNLDMVKLLLENGAQSDLRTTNKVYMTPIEYTLKNSKEREFLLAIDPTLAELDGDDNKEEEENDSKDS